MHDGQARLDRATPARSIPFLCIGFVASETAVFAFREALQSPKVACHEDDLHIETVSPSIKAFACAFMWPGCHVQCTGPKARDRLQAGVSKRKYWIPVGWKSAKFCLHPPKVQEYEVVLGLNNARGVDKDDRMGQSTVC